MKFYSKSKVKVILVTVLLSVLLSVFSFKNEIKSKTHIGKKHLLQKGKYLSSKNANSLKLFTNKFRKVRKVSSQNELVSKFAKSKNKKYKLLRTHKVKANNSLTSFKKNKVNSKFTKNRNFKSKLLISRKKYKRLHSKRRRSEERDDKKYPKATELKDGNSGSILSLENHNVECSGASAISGFHLFLDKGLFSNDNAYEWKCENSTMITPSKTIAAETIRVLIDDEKNSCNLLMYMPVSCPRKYVIQQFKIDVAQGPNIYYKYKCVETKLDYSNCIINTSEWKAANWSLFLGIGSTKSISQIAQLEVSPQTGYALTSFTLQFRPDNKEIAYTYSNCLIVKQSLNSQEFKPPYNPTANELKKVNSKNKNFVGLNLDCGDGYFTKINIKEDASAIFACKSQYKSKIADPISLETVLSEITVLVCPAHHVLSKIAFSEANSTYKLKINYTCISALVAGEMREYNGNTINGDINTVLGKTDIKIPDGEAILMIRWEPELSPKNNFQMNKKRVTTITARFQAVVFANSGVLFKSYD